MTISRVTRSKEQARKTYDRLSRWYDWFANGSESKLIEAGLEILDVLAGEVVLEIGFGTGYGIIALAKAVGGRGKVHGIDISQGMLIRTLVRAKEMGLGERVELRLGDATRLPYAEDHFDAIFMSFTLELFDTPEIPILLTECRRVLKGTGRIGVIAMSKMERAGWMLRLYEWAHHHFPTYVDCRPILVQKALRDAGFQSINTLEQDMWGLPVTIALATKRAKGVW